ncbi:MAG: hypothetical protein J5601_03725 [Elusimicrobiaceae bacterium]|nr:hypothetical protein [Elusimicrobiaceae bacterium]
MKKDPGKQAITTITGAVLNYPKVHTVKHPNAFKVPIADLLNPDCPISAGVSDNLRAELLKKKARGAQYHYIDDYIYEYSDIKAVRGALAKKGGETRRRIEQANLKERFEKEQPAIAEMETALDPDNPLSVLRISDATRLGILAVKTIADAIAPELPPDALTFFLDNVNKITPIVNAALEEKGLDINTLTLPEVVQAVSIADAIRAAGYTPKEPTEAAGAELPATMAGKIELLDMPIDNLSAVTFSRLQTDKKVKKLKITPGQLSFDFVNLNDAQYVKDNIDKYDAYKINVAHRGEPEAIIIYAINFENLPGVKITKELTEHDKRVYIAMCGLSAAGFNKYHNYNFCVTVNQIAYAMGLSSNPSQAQKNAINDSITKLNSTHIFIENYYESQVHKSRKREIYDGSFLPMERITTERNGQQITAIHPFRDAPMFAFAKARKQITTIKREWLAVPVNQTEKQLGLQHYFLEWIAMLKNDHNNSQHPEISYKRLCDVTNTTDRKGKERLPEQVKKILEHYKKTGCITDYAEISMQAGGKGIKISL